MAKLECKNLSLTIKGIKLLDDINITAEPGITVIAGENGSGKSLLLKCIMSIISSFEGQVLLDGKPTSKLKKPIRYFNFIPPSARSAIIGETGLEDVLFGIGKKTDENVKKAIDALGACKAENLAFKSTNTMSTGELRRINIASQNVLERDIVLADEPFTGLDYMGSLALVRLIKLMKESGKTIVIVSHDLDKFLKYADKLIILKNGKVVECGKPEELLDILEQNNIHRPKGNIENMEWL